MKPRNFMERRKKMVAFAGFYAAAVVLLFFIFSAFRGESSMGERPLTRPEGNSSLQPASTAAAGEQQEIVKRENELLEKGAVIISLENKLKAVQDKLKDTQDKLDAALVAVQPLPVQNSALPDPAAVRKMNALAKENESLKESLKQEDDAANDLKDMVRGLRAGNENLTAQLSEHNRPATTAAPADPAGNLYKARAAALEDKLKSMDAELYFTKVDCNLSRADAHQIIYTSRQRKDLLTESLSILNNLLKSDDPSVRKKAKDKLLHLNHIANTLRD